MHRILLKIAEKKIFLTDVHWCIIQQLVLELFLVCFAKYLYNLEHNVVVSDDNQWFWAFWNCWMLIVYQWLCCRRMESDDQDSEGLSKTRKCWGPDHVIVEKLAALTYTFLPSIPRHFYKEPGYFYFLYVWGDLHFHNFFFFNPKATQCSQSSQTTTSGIVLLYTFYRILPGCWFNW